jgi:hypothetical protein
MNVNRLLEANNYRGGHYYPGKNDQFLPGGRQVQCSMKYHVNGFYALQAWSMEQGAFVFIKCDGICGYKTCCSCYIVSANFKKVLCRH